MCVVCVKVLELQSGKLSAGVTAKDGDVVPNDYRELQERNQQLEVSCVTAVIIGDISDVVASEIVHTTSLVLSVV